MLGIHQHHDKVLVIRSFSNPLNTIYVYHPTKKRTEVKAYISIDFKMFTAWEIFLADLKKNKFYIEWDSFDDKFRVRFHYPISDKDDNRN